jgi:hypothetical protein
VPWAIAAVSLLAFGASLTLQLKKDSPSARVETPAAPTKAAAAPAPVEVDEVDDAAVQEAELIEAEAQELEEELAAELEEEESAVVQTPASKEEAPTVVEAQVAEEAKTAPGQIEGEVATTDKAVEAQAADESADVEADAAEEEAPLAPFSASAASSALREATALATSCRQPGDPTGSATVVVTFAPSGRVTRASVTGAPFAGTTTGGCIASRFRSATVPAFSGDFVTVKKTVNIE